MSYKITIQETVTETHIIGKDWEIIGDEEVSRKDEFLSPADRENEPKTRISKVYGYTPEIEKQVEVTRDVLIQEVEELDFPAVIRAINNL